ncbi:MAG: NAD(P)H-dependent oxidoreductase [Alphaproteobacteria bacterium]
MTMHIAIISGSHRAASQSRRVADYLAARLTQQNSTTTDVIDLAGNPLPLWDESAWQANSALSQQWQPYAQRLQAADGLIVISPEWAGMAAPGLKNFLLFASAADVGHKPALIVTVSAARGGAYPVNELRTSSYKNNKLLYIPEHLIIRDVATMFAGDAPSGGDDAYLRDRTDFALNILLAYSAALGSVRQSGVTTHEKFANGM